MKQGKNKQLTRENKEKNDRDIAKDKKWRETERAWGGDQKIERKEQGRKTEKIKEWGKENYRQRVEEKKGDSGRLREERN
jgi:hypothetical protein